MCDTKICSLLRLLLLFIFFFSRNRRNLQGFEQGRLALIGDHALDTAFEPRPTVARDRNLVIRISTYYVVYAIVIEEEKNRIKKKKIIAEKTIRFCSFFFYDYPIVVIICGTRAFPRAFNLENSKWPVREIYYRFATDDRTVASLFASVRAHPPAYPRYKTHSAGFAARD